MGWLAVSEVQSIIIMVGHGDVQADMVLELRAYIFLGTQQEVNWDTGCGLRVCETLKSASTVTHFLQQGHTYSNKATPPNSVIPYEIMGANCIQTPTGCFNP